MNKSSQPAVKETHLFQYLNPTFRSIKTTDLKFPCNQPKTTQPKLQSNKLADLFTISNRLFLQVHRNKGSTSWILFDFLKKCTSQNQNVWNICELYFTAGPFLPGHLFVHFLVPASLLEGPHLYLAVDVISLFVVCCLLLLFFACFLSTFLYLLRYWKDPTSI